MMTDATQGLTHDVIPEPQVNAALISQEALISSQTALAVSQRSYLNAAVPVNPRVQKYVSVPVWGKPKHCNLVTIPEYHPGMKATNFAAIRLSENFEDSKALFNNSAPGHKVAMLRAKTIHIIQNSPNKPIALLEDIREEIGAHKISLMTRFNWIHNPRFQPIEPVADSRVPMFDASVTHVLVCDDLTTTTSAIPEVEAELRALQQREQGQKRKYPTKKFYVDLPVPVYKIEGGTITPLDIVVNSREHDHHQATFYITKGKPGTDMLTKLQ